MNQLALSETWRRYGIRLQAGEFGEKLRTLKNEN